MYRFVYLSQILIFSIIWKPNLSAEYIAKFTAGLPLIKIFKIPRPDVYEIEIGGACGGGTDNGNGGYGGVISGLYTMQGIEELSIAVGEIGQTKSDTCGTAGGGGATAVFINRDTNAAKGEIILVAPGGGGGGYFKSAPSPDYLESISASDSKQCSNSDKLYQAAPGRSINNYLSYVNLSYNPTIQNENLTAGCLGGYGGGGQGGFMYKLKNYTDGAGGGGGGGGYAGGEVLMNGVTSGCMAGGPGKPFCKANYCAVPKANPGCAGYFIIRKHELYKELPLKDRTNYERPRVDKNLGLGGCILTISLSCLIMSLIWNIFYKHLDC